VEGLINPVGFSEILYSTSGMDCMIVSYFHETRWIMIVPHDKAKNTKKALPLTSDLTIWNDGSTL